MYQFVYCSVRLQAALSLGLVHHGLGLVHTNSCLVIIVYILLHVYTLGLFV